MGLISWSQVLANLGLAAIVVVAWIHLLEQFPGIDDRNRTRFLGIVLATGAMLSMSVPLVEFDGYRADLRSTMILLAGYFGGPTAAVIAALPVAAYRFHLGGAGTGVGIALAIIYATIGVAAGRVLDRRILNLVLLALLAGGLNMVLTYLLVPARILDGVGAATIPLSLAAMANVLLIGLALQHDEDRRRLERTNARYRAMVDTLPECLNLKDRDGRFLIANPATAAQLGVGDVGDVVGRSDADFHPPELAATFREDELEVMRARQAKTYTQRFKRPDGSEGWLSTIKAPILDRGNVAGVITHNRDISEQRRLQAELDTTRQRLTEALENMGEGLVVIDRDGVIVLCNERYRELFPLTAHLRIPGANLADVLHAAAQLGEESWSVAEASRGATGQPVSLLTLNRDRKIRLADGRTLRAQTRSVADGGHLILITDITDREALEAELRYRATHDPLTGLANREQLAAAIRRARELAAADGRPAALMLIDLDHFKQINDSHGHLAGDHLLVNVARRIEAELGPDDVCARLGGDEFAVVSRSEPTTDAVAALAGRIIEAIGKPLTYLDADVTPGASLGYVMLSAEPVGAEELLRRADRALYAAKTQGRGRTAAYSETMEADAVPEDAEPRRRRKVRDSSPTTR